MYNVIPIIIFPSNLGRVKCYAVPGFRNGQRQFPDMTQNIDDHNSCE